jgi:hypothetical protein
MAQEASGKRGEGGLRRQAPEVGRDAKGRTHHDPLSPATRYPSHAQDRRLRAAQQSVLFLAHCKNPLPCQYVYENKAGYPGIDRGLKKCKLLKKSKLIKPQGRESGKIGIPRKARMLLKTKQLSEESMSSAEF